MSQTFCDGPDVDLDAIDYNLPWLNTCELCNKSYANRRYLQQHQRRNHPPSFLCSICGKTYAGQSYFLIHLKICKDLFTLKKIWHHQQQVPRARRARRPNFLCSVCGKTYTIKSSLVFHMKKSHPLEYLRTTSIWYVFSRSIWMDLTDATFSWLSGSTNQHTYIEYCTRDFFVNSASNGTL